MFCELTRNLGIRNLGTDGTVPGCLGYFGRKRGTYRMECGTRIVE